MKTYSIAEINDLDHGIPISRFEGRIKKVFEQKSGEGQYGTWYLQNLIVEDGQQEITVTWTGDDAFDAGVEGQTYSFETGYDKKDKPVGIVRDIRTKNGKKYEGVKVDNRSKIKVVSSDQQGKMSNDEIDSTYERIDATKAKGEYPPQHDIKGGAIDSDWPEAPESHKTEPQSPPASQNGNGGVTDARKHLMQSANLYNLCVACVEKVIAPSLPVVAQTSEMFQAATGTLFIEASRAGYVQKMPEKPL